MYLILNHAGRIVDISEEARHVRRQQNGVVIGCEQKDADAIYSANTDAFYPIEPTGYIGDGHTLVKVKKVPPEVVAGYYFYHNGEFYSTEQELEKLARANAEADLVPVASLISRKRRRLTQLLSPSTARFLSLTFRVSPTKPGRFALTPQTVFSISALPRMVPSTRQTSPLKRATSGSVSRILTTSGPSGSRRPAFSTSG